MTAPPPDKPARILPKNWPEDVPYLYAPRHSPALTGSQLAAIRVAPAQPAGDAATAAVPRNLRRGPCAAVEIRTITDPRHPAAGQRGLFAARRLEPGALVLPYLGEVHPGTVDDDDHQRRQQHSHAESDYDLWLSRDADVAVDAARCGNEARFVNDYRGVPGAVRANAEFREIWDPRPQTREPPGGCGAAAAEAGASLPPSVQAAGEWTMAVFVLPVGKKALAKQQQKQQQQQQQKRCKLLGAVAGGGRRERPLGGINEGEEILVSYGKGFWEKRKQENEARGREEEQVQEVPP